MANYTIMGHPLIQHKISLIRDKRTGTNEFRKLVEEIAMLMGYEALRDLPPQRGRSTKAATLPARTYRPCTPPNNRPAMPGWLHLSRQALRLFSPYPL